MADVRLTDCTDGAKVLVRADPDGATAAALGVRLGRAVRDGDGVLVVRTAPDAWLLLAPAGRPVAPLAAGVEAAAGGEFVSAVDVTHGHALVRLRGAAAAPVLSSVCAIDLTDAATRQGAVFRSLLAGISATIIRDDSDGQLSYLVLCDRSYGRFLTDVLTDAGASGS